MPQDAVDAKGLDRLRNHLEKFNKEKKSITGDFKKRIKIYSQEIPKPQDCFKSTAEGKYHRILALLPLL